MSAKLIFVVGLAVVSLAGVLGAPKAIHSEKEFRESFVEFLKQDKEFIKGLERTAAEALSETGSQLRNRRQVELEADAQNVDAVEEEAQEKPGFFDRAARFMMEILQRFLKWINTDSN